MTNTITIDREATYLSWAAEIDTENFLAATLGEQLEHAPEFDGWLVEHEQQMLGWIEDQQDGRRYQCTPVDNTFNHENDFSSEFQFIVFYPEDAGDWIWSEDCYVGIEVHQGGDVRGNYGRIRLYGPVNSLGDCGFFDWVIGWHATYRDGEEVEYLNERAGIGYASNPTCELESHLKTRDNTRWCASKEAFLAIDEDNRAVLLTPYHYAGF